MSEIGISKTALGLGGLGCTRLRIVLVLPALNAVALHSTFGVNCFARFIGLAGFQLDGLSADCALRPIAQK